MTCCVFGQGPGPQDRGFEGRPGPRGGPGGRGVMGPFGGGQSAAWEYPPLAKDEAEQKILDLLKEISRKQGWMMNVPEVDGRLLRLLAEAIGAKQAVEFGTSNGVSAIWISLALRKTGGKLITFEINKDVAALARENFKDAGLSDLVTIVEGDAHKTAKKLTGPIDFVFIDADKEGYLDYLNKTLPLVRPGGLIVAHNINPRMANAEYVKAITSDPDLETIFYTPGGGISVTLKKR
jgi:caffeoyl-CoA O-methyltransferase